MKLARPPRAVIYDLDGVLLDTEHFYTEVTQEIVAKHGKQFDWSVKMHMIGRPAAESAAYLVRTLQLPITAEEYLRTRSGMLAERFPSAQPIPGAVAFTRAIHGYSLPQAVATSSERDVFALKTTRHREWFSLFSTTVTGDDPRLERGKPAPDIFLLAASELSIDPRDCLVFEDAPAGVEAARAAGMQVIAMPDRNVDRVRVASADLIVDGFSELTPADFGL